MNYAIRFLGLLMACLLVFACGNQMIKGSGNITTQTYDVAVFNNVKLDGTLNVAITVSDAAQSLTISADDNLQPYLIHTVKDGTLEISVKSNDRLMPTQPINVRVNVKQLDSLYVRGTTIVNVTGVQSDSFEMNADGTSQILISGKAEAASMTLAGTLVFDARNFIVQDLTVDVCGTVDAKIFAIQKLTAKITGGSTTYFGNPPVVNQTVTGGSLQKGEPANAGNTATMPQEGMPAATAPGQSNAPAAGSVQPPPATDSSPAPAGSNAAPTQQPPENNTVAPANVPLNPNANPPAPANTESNTQMDEMQ
jgi:hypothetical protein